MSLLVGNIYPRTDHISSKSFTSLLRRFPTKELESICIISSGIWTIYLHKDFQLLNISFNTSGFVKILWKKTTSTLPPHHILGKVSDNLPRILLGEHTVVSWFGRYPNIELQDNDTLVTHIVPSYHLKQELDSNIIFQISVNHSLNLPPTWPIVSTPWIWWVSSDKRNRGTPIPPADDAEESSVQLHQPHPGYIFLLCFQWRDIQHSTFQEYTSSPPRHIPARSGDAPRNIHPPYVECNFPRATHFTLWEYFWYSLLSHTKSPACSSWYSGEGSDDSY